MGTVKLLKATVGHARLKPKKNTFSYKVYYTITPVNHSSTVASPAFFSFDRFNLLSHYAKDYGYREQKKSWWTFIETECEKAGFRLTKNHRVELISHPRLLGYNFNPISYWMVSDKEGLRAVLCEVHNTFKQTHNYMLHKNNFTVIKPSDVLAADKELYVSPYNTMDGYYEFTFAYDKENFKSVINYFTNDGSQIMNTYMGGQVSDLTNKKILSLLFMYPAMTLLVVARIHWQAVILFFKKVRPTLRVRPKKNYINGKTTQGREKK